MNGPPLDHTPFLPASPATRDFLPPIPREPHDSLNVAPPPPPKFVAGPSSSPNSANIPLTPTTPISPTAPSNTDTKPKRSNPLNDLIDTEKQYVDQLTGVIRKVAAAWSRTNLPPHDLDIMFRSIEGVYKANRGLYSKLREIGTNPSSPKALGDLLMRWIDDLKGPYTTYCTKYCSGFDVWEPVQSNPKLAGVLAAFSASCPPPTPSESSTWTLDALFLLPKTRLKYYNKLYGRLLKTTEPGRSDYRLLVGALDTLEFLIGVVESRSTIQAGEASEISQPPSVETEDEVVIDTRPGELPPVLPPIQSVTSSQPASESGASSPPGGSISRGGRSSQETMATTASGSSTSTLSRPVSELERRLRTDRTLDIFTMKPKTVTLHMNPPTLTFTRELVFSADVVIRFVPRNTTEEVIHRQGHIFLLSDLFLVCERMSREEQAQYAAQGADMWLCYPPLAGKVLRVTDIEGRDNALQVAIMRKEFLTLELPSVEIRDVLSKHLKECIEFSSTLPPPAKSPPPPVPPINPMFANRGDASGSSRNSPISRVGSPQSLDAHSPEPSSISSTRSPPPEASLAESMNRMRMDGPSSLGRPSPHPGLPEPNNLRAPASAQPYSNHLPPLGPGHIPPPARSTSFQSGPASGPGFGPSYIPGPSSLTHGPPHIGSPPHSLGPPHMNGLPHQPGVPHMNGSAPHPPGPPHMRGPSHQSGPQMGGPPYPPGPPHIGGYPHPSGRPHMQSPPPHGAPLPQRNNAPPLGQHPPGPMSMQGGPFNGPPRSGPFGLPPGSQPPRPPSELQALHPGIRKTPSTRSLTSQFSQHDQPPPAPPVPSRPNGFGPSMSRDSSFSTLHAPHPRPLLPSANARAISVAEASFDAPSPPGSPVAKPPQATGPLTSTISAQMKCKVFLQQQHSQWKSLGSGKLKLYRQDPTNIKQLVVEADDKNKTILISTIVLTDGVERVGKTGVAIELSDQGARTGVIYMIQLRNESSAGGLFESLLAGSDRSH